jgi:hypothetical protein
VQAKSAHTNNTKETMNMTQQTTPTKPIAILERICNNVIVVKTPIVTGYTSIYQYIDNEKSELLINDDEVDDLISILQNYKEQLEGYND